MALKLPRDWRLRKERYELIGGQCQECHAFCFPLRDVCPQCGKVAVQPFQFSGKGEVYSFAVMLKAPDGFAQDVPYVVALVKLAEGPLVTAQISDVDPATVTIGMPVEMIVRRWREEGADGPIIYGYKFRPVGFGVAK